MNRRSLVFISFLVILTGCGSTQTATVDYTDSASPNNPPNFVIFISSDLASNFTQALTPATDSVSQRSVFYYTASPDNLKNCAVAEGLVNLSSTYHTGSPTVSNCSQFANSLRSEGLFPAPTAEINLSKAAVKMSGDGYVYALFVYNVSAADPTKNPQGSDVSANQAVPAANPCVKIWGAKVTNASVVSTSDQPLTSIDLAGLVCYGI